MKRTLETHRPRNLSVPGATVGLPARADGHARSAPAYAHGANPSQDRQPLPVIRDPRHGREYLPRVRSAVSADGPQGSGLDRCGAQKNAATQIATATPDGQTGAYQSRELSRGLRGLFAQAQPSGQTKKMGLRSYRPVLTAEVNRKGVLDIDVVKGCSLGLGAHGPRGCYDACYAALIARFRGIDFARAVTRKVVSCAHAKAIEKTVRAAPLGFFRVGTMGDPCHDWSATVETVEWLAPLATPVIVTKHWRRATDDQFLRLIACGAVLNTSISALDTAKELRRREREIARYAGMGGKSVARIVSCDFDARTERGQAMSVEQARLFTSYKSIDNPLRVPRTHPLVADGVIRVRRMMDIASMRSISVSESSNSYTGHCDGCSDKCGMAFSGGRSERPKSVQHELF